MPNGGSDCCGTCWFNRANHGRAGSVNHDHSIPSHCEIRDLAIEDPFYTYCANHPYRRPDQDPIPIGPVLRPGDVTPETPEIAPTVLDTGTEWSARVVWKASPDNEEIRGHLLELLADLEEQAGKDRYFPTPSMAAAVIWQLGEFRESRAVRSLTRIIELYDEDAVEDAREALAKIRGGPEEDPAKVETKQPNPAKDLFLEVTSWLLRTYSSHRFFVARDVIWTVQKRLWREIAEQRLPYRVFHNFGMPGNPTARADLAILDTRETVLLAAEFQYEPDRARAGNDIGSSKFPVVDWKKVTTDVSRVQGFVARSRARSAVSVFLDEGGHFRFDLRKPAPRPSRWLSPPVEDAPRLSILISQAPGTAPRRLP